MTAAFQHTWEYAVAQWRADEQLLEESEDIDDPDYVAIEMEG